jgi:NAD(P)-dependent dehydrogenase (short-subunit alcohol dehydrogenase family)
MSRLQGKTALVTGGRQGIGRAIVGCFAAEGARVMTCGRGPRPADLPDTVLWQTADVADKADIDALTDRVVAEFGELSILVNNAGVQIEKTVPRLYTDHVPRRLDHQHRLDFCLDRRSRASAL